MGRTLSKAMLAALVAGAFTAPTAIAEGEFSGNVALGTEYVWRGITQSDGDFAVSGGFDYANGPFYVGTWAANVDFGDGETHTELDLYGGVAGEFENGIGWDVGAIAYFYPGGAEDLDFVEVYGGLGGSLGSIDLGGYVYYDFDNENTYVEGTAGFALTEKYGLDASVGNYSFDGGGDYTAYSVGLTKSTELVDFDLRFWGTDIDNVDAADDRVVLTVSRAL